MRVSLNLSEEMLDRVDQEAKRLGTSRGSMLTAWVGEKIAQLDMSRSFTDSIKSDLLNVVKAAISDPQSLKNLAAAAGIPSNEEIEEQLSLLEDEK